LNAPERRVAPTPRHERIRRHCHINWKIYRLGDGGSRCKRAHRLGQGPDGRLIENALIVQRASLDEIDGKTQPLVSSDGDVLFAAHCRLDNREELGGVLGLAGAELVQTSDAALLLRIFERWGDTGVATSLWY
jgi:Glutamine amidotransferase domain